MMMVVTVERGERRRMQSINKAAAETHRLLQRDNLPNGELDTVNTVRTEDNPRNYVTSDRDRKVQPSCEQAYRFPPLVIGKCDK